MKEFANQGRPNQSQRLGDFTTSWHVVPVTLLAALVGVVSSYVALGLLRLIGLFTNLFFFQRIATTLTSPAANRLGIFEVFIPMIGGLIVGLMARYGSERIRGHGIPEAIEAILLKGGKIEPRVAFLKPLSSAISIGSGGPFGAEGPIIMTGGAFGSMIAQFFRLTSLERRTLLVAGAAAGMSATFAAPLAAVLLSVELLLFEWKPRSLIPVAIASATAAVVRRHILGMGPMFPTPPLAPAIGWSGIGGCVLVGVLAGALAVLLTLAVYSSEDVFQKLRIHWMWWPVIGGFVVGLGGLVFPQALGVGYDVIGLLLRGDVVLKTIAGILLVKSIIWAVSLGSGTSGGVVAPLLMLGGALGGLLSGLLPNEGAGFWPLIAMAAVLAGTMRAPLTGVVFAAELTHDWNAVLPLLLASTVAYALTVLTLRRSILTEKVARRGYHLSCEYAVDPLEILFVREVMRSDILTLSADTSTSDLVGREGERYLRSRQGLFPVVDCENRFVGVLDRETLEQLILRKSGDRIVDVAGHESPVAFLDDPLRVVVYRMAATGLTRLPVVERGGTPRLAGLITLNDLLKARTHTLEAEFNRERILPFRIWFPLRRKQPAA
jgi:chloride channel protein, CIC family